MTRPISQRTTVSVLKQDAKRWLRALRENDAAAHHRLREAWPQAPSDPVLRDVQHALAREYGQVSWVALLEQLSDLAVERQGRSEWVRAILSHGWDGDVRVARRLAARHPELAQDSIFAAAAMGDVTAVASHLRQAPALAMATCEVRGWSALAHVMYGRLDEQHAVAIAQHLINAGADVHFVFTDAWDNPFTLLTGVAGDGEGAKPAHAQMTELAAMLLDHGVDPFDTQLLYNTSLHHDDVRWLELLWSRSVERGVDGQWRAHEGKRLGGRFGGNTLNYLLGNAVLRNHETRVRWLLEHGADANARHAYSGRRVHTEARLAGFSAGVSLLEAHGAQAESLPSMLEFMAAVMLDDRETTGRLLAQQPALIRAAGPLHRAAMQGRTELIERLLSLGADVHATDHEGSTPLHRAVQGGSLRAVTTLLEAGADINRREPRFQGTALSWAIALSQPEIAEFLVPLSSDVRALARLGEVERIRAVLVMAPAGAREQLSGVDAPTALFCFAEDDDTAFDVVDVLLEFGADRLVRDKEGRTAYEVARQRGLERTAERLKR